MSIKERPTSAEKADAADRWVDAKNEALASLHKCWLILREQTAAGATRTGPLFPFVGRDVDHHLDKAREALYEAHKLVAIQGYDEHRASRPKADPT